MKYVRWILPNKTDFFCLAFLLLCTTALLMVNLLSQNYYWFRGWYSRDAEPLAISIPYAAVLLAALASISCWSWETICKRWIVVVATGGSFLLLLVTAQMLSVPMWFDSRTVSGGEPKTEIAAATVLALLGLATIVSTRLLDWMCRWRRKRAGGAILTRTQWVIMIAVVLFACSLFYRILESDFRDRLYVVGRITDLTVVLLMVPIALAAIPTLLANRIKSFWGRMLAGAFLFVTSFVMANLLVGSGFFEASGAIICFGIYSLLLGFAILCLRVPEASEDDCERLPTRMKRPSLWGATVLLVLIVGVAVTSFYEPFILMSWDKSNRFQVARSIRLMQLSKGTNTSANRNPWRQGLGLDVRQSAATSPEYFRGFQELEKMNVFLGIDEISPQVKTNPLIRHAINCRIRGGAMTASQFADLCGRATWSTYVSNVSVVKGPEVSSENRSWGQLIVSDVEAEDVERMLKVVKATDSVTEISLRRCVLDRAAWEQVFRLSEFHEVSVDFDQLTPSILEASTHYETPFLSLETYGYQWGRFVDHPLDGKLVWQILLDSDLVVRLPNLHSVVPASPAEVDYIETYQTKFWDAVFASKGTAEVKDSMNADVGDFRNFREFCVARHWAYGESVKVDRIEHLLVGMYDQTTLSEAAKITELKSLSFDNQWVPGLRKAYQYAGFQLKKELGAFSRLVNLEELILAKGMDVDNFLFLGKMKKLKHLQYDCFSETKPNFSAKLCPQLESLYLYSWPEPWLVREIAKLKSLKKFVVVETGEVAKTAVEKQRLVRLLPKGFPLEMLRSEDLHKAPQEFQEHVKRVRKNVREKYLGKAD